MARLAQIYNSLSGLGPLDPAEKSLYSIKNPQGWPVGTLSNDSGIKVNEQRSLAHTGVYRCLTLLGGALASSPKHIFHKPPEGKRELARLHPAYRLFHEAPNEFMTSYQFFFLWTAHRMLWGNFYAIINRNEFFEPVSIIPVQPWQMTVKMVGNRKTYIHKGREYEPENVIHDFGLSLDGLTGVRPIHYMSENVGTGLAADKMIASSFGKGLHAGGVLIPPDEDAGFMGSTDEEAEDETEAMRESIRRQYQDGPSSWHNLLILDPGWKFEQFKLHFQIDQLVTALKFNLADIARMFGVPLHKLMELDRATNNNIEHQAIEFTQDGVMPLAVGIESQVNAKLIRESEKPDYYANIDLDGLQRADIKTRYEAYTMALGARSAAWMEPSEIREQENMTEGNPDKWPMPMNQTTKEREQQES